MKALIVLIFLLCAGLAGAQTLSKKRVDRHTGDTTQYSSLWTLYYPLTERLLNWGYTRIHWSIEKIAPKAHGSDTTLLYLQFDPNADFTFARGTNLLNITFTDGHAIRLTASFTQEQYLAATTEGDDHSIYLQAKYPLSAADIQALSSETIASACFSTTKGPQTFTISYANAHRLQRKVSGLARNAVL